LALGFRLALNAITAVSLLLGVHSPCDLTTFPPVSTMAAGSRSWLGALISGCPAREDGVAVTGIRQSGKL